MFEWLDNLVSGAFLYTCILAGVFFSYTCCRMMFGHRRQLLYNLVGREDDLSDRYIGLQTKIPCRSTLIGEIL